MKPGDKLLAVNGESVLGYTVEKVAEVFRIISKLTDQVGLVILMSFRSILY